MVCFAAYVAVQILFGSSNDTDKPDRIFAAFMIPSFMLMYITPFIWLFILIHTCIKRFSVASFVVVCLLGFVVWYMQVTLVIAYH